MLGDTFTSKTTCLLVLTWGTQRFTESAEELLLLRKEVLVTWQKKMSHLKEADDTGSPSSLLCVLPLLS